MPERVNAACQNGDIDYMIERLRVLRSPATDYWCWGYGFPWQTRTIVVPGVSQPGLHGVRRQRVIGRF
jgi:hypothetical protein